MWKLEHKSSGFSSEFVGFNQNTRVSHILANIIFFQSRYFLRTGHSADPHPKLKDWLIIEIKCLASIHQDGGLVGVMLPGTA